jgi:predicted amidohydrolase YtcJ
VADIVYMNGRIYTVDAAQPWAEALAIKDGRFLAVGRDSDVEPVTADGTDVVDLDGAFVMRGIVDMHAHPFTGVDLGTGSANLTQPGDLDTVLADVSAYANAHPDKDVILGGNWLIGGALDPDDSPDNAQGHRFARPAQTVFWRNTDATYWIQWTVKNDVAVLWANDHDASEAVEILRVRG